MSERPVHDRLEELYAAEALGGLDDDARNELRGILTWHDAHCAQCERLRADYSEVASSLALSLEPVPLSSGAEERLMTATRTVPQGRTARPPARPVTTLDDAREEHEERRRHPMRVVVTALGAAACLLGAVVLGYSLRAPESPSQEIAAAFAAQPGTQSTTMQDGGHQVVVYYRPGQGAALVVASGMDDPPAGHVYEVWYRAQGDTDMTPAGVFVPEDDGTAVAPASVSEDFTAMAVSVEPGYETAPTGEVVLSTPSS